MNEQEAQDLEQVKQQRNFFAGQIAEIKAVLSEVAVFEGMPINSTAHMVSEIVHDHEELERRIDQAMLYLAGIEADTMAIEIRDEVVKILRGQRRTPDDLSALDL